MVGCYQGCRSSSRLEQYLYSSSSHDQTRMLSLSLTHSMMKTFAIAFFFAATAVPLIAGQFVAPPSDLITKQGFAGVNVRYKEVPTGICELDPTVKSFSGYADVEENQHIFWWFFEARNTNPENAPLTVWINGGPGASSMIGLFQELGPCYIDSDLNPYSNPFSWT